MCDISFMTEDFLDLDALAREHETTVVADCGVAPGMSNMLSSWGVSKLDHAERVEILVGGVPRERYAPWEYKAGFSPYDVIEEYVRPSRVVEHGEIVIKRYGTTNCKGNRRCKLQFTPQHLQAPNCNQSLQVDT